MKNRELVAWLLAKDPDADVVIAPHGLIVEQPFLGRSRTFIFIPDTDESKREGN